MKFMKVAKGSFKKSHQKTALVRSAMYDVLKHPSVRLYNLSHYGLHNEPRQDIQTGQSLVRSYIGVFN